ncbi:MAG: hypothetical protein K0M58_00565 [Thiobacillus sp.]|nr:hypothetical protein [Thiobacillus sp.]
MAKGSELNLALKIKAFVDGLKNVTGLNREVKELGATASKPIPDPTPPLRDGANKTTRAVQELGGALVGVVSIAAIQQFVRTSVNEFARAESAFRGLEAVANHSGVGIGRAMQEAEKLAADGSMTVAESSKALQNLLARGYNVDQAVTTLTRLKDAAAFNRAANLSMGEAVVSASEGLKNENSILVDNAGLTKNISVIWKEYAASVGKSVDELTLHEKIAAEVAGVIRETEAQLGNAAKAADGFAGQMNKADAEMKKFGGSLGQILAPAMIGLAQIGTFIIRYVFVPLVKYMQIVGTGFAALATGLGLAWNAVTKLDFDGLWAKRMANLQNFGDAVKEIWDRPFDAKFEPTGDGAKKAAEDTTEATAEMGKAMKQAAKDRKDSVNEQIKDAERLRGALIKAFDESLQAEESYRDQAKQLRAEATQKPKDDSVEGQASAMLDLIAAEQKLQRIKSSEPLDDVQAQAEMVRQLAANLDDQARAQEAINRSKLAEADALDRAAAGEVERQAGITEQQRLNDERLAQFQAMLKDLEAGKTVKIEANTEQARTAVEQVKVLWDAIQDKTVTLTMNQAGAAASPIPGHATGTILPGYGGGDRRLILAEDGEAITRKESVAYYGRSFMAALNARQIPRFAEGGIVSALASSSVSSGGAGLHPVTLHMPGGDTYSMSAAPNVVAELQAAIAREALKHGRRR